MQTKPGWHRLFGRFLKHIMTVTLTILLGVSLALQAPGSLFGQPSVPTAPGAPATVGADGTRLAFAVTSAEKQAEADEILRRLDELQTELNRISVDYLAAIAAHDDALAKMIDAQIREAAAETRIQELQIELGSRAQQMYRQGPGSFLDVLFGAKSFTELITAVDLMNRVNSHDAALVVESKEARAAAEAARIEYTEMERVSREKQTEMGALKAQREAMAVEMQAQAEQLTQEAAELRIQEELAAEEARRRAEELARNTANGGSPVTPDQIAKVPPLTHPCPGNYGITSPYGYREFDGIFHQGCDFGASTGTPIYAAAAGTVAYSGWENMGGNVVYMVHGNGVRTVYGHASQLLCSTGEYVEAGQLIALVGSTGYATGPHLHFQLEVDGSAIDPLVFL